MCPGPFHITQHLLPAVLCTLGRHLAILGNTDSRLPSRCTDSGSAFPQTPRRFVCVRCVRQGNSALRGISKPQTPVLFLLMNENGVRFGSGFYFERGNGCSRDSLSTFPSASQAPSKHLEFLRATRAMKHQQGERLKCSWGRASWSPLPNSIFSLNNHRICSFFCSWLCFSGVVGIWCNVRVSHCSWGDRCSTFRIVARLQSRRDESCQGKLSLTTNHWSATAFPPGGCGWSISAQLQAAVFLQKGTQCCLLSNISAPNKLNPYYPLSCL